MRARPSMVISASRRSDLPAYYSDWLLGRLEAGSCLVRNPFDARRSRRVGLRPEEIDFLVFWTRDPRPLLPRMRDLDEGGLRSYFQMTITGYPSSMEPGAPPLDEAIAALGALSGIVGPRRVLWRYDPIFVAESLSPDFHRRNFEHIATALEGRTERVTFSLLDEYAGTSSRLAKAGFPGAIFGSPRGSSQAEAPPTGSLRSGSLREPYPALLAELAAIARSRAMLPLACAEPYDLSALGIETGACIDPDLAKELWGIEGSAGRDPGQRRACGCAASVDIGAYGSCPRGCAYCYANRGSGRLLDRGSADEAL